jgi:hypothetical protein
MMTVFRKKAQKEEKERLSSSPWDDDGLRLDDAFALVIRQAPFRFVISAARFIARDARPRNFPGTDFSGFRD